VNKGWQATTAAGKSFGPPVLVDGFANGWMVDPATIGAAAAHGGSFELTLTWLPQHGVTQALKISALAALLCLLLALLPNRWRRQIFFRRRRRRAAQGRVGDGDAGVGDAGDGRAGAEDGETADHEGVVAMDGAGPRTVRVKAWASNDPPELTTPLSAGGRRPRWWAFVVAPVLAGAIAAGLLTRPRIGLVVAVAVLFVLVIRHLRWLLTLSAIGLIAATAEYTVKHQSLFHFPAGGWPINFEPASDLAWAAVVILAADAIVELARGGALRPVVTDAGSPVVPDPGSTVVPDNEIVSPPSPDAPAVEVAAADLGAAVDEVTVTDGDAPVDADVPVDEVTVADHDASVDADVSVEENVPMDDVSMADGDAPVEDDAADPGVPAEEAVVADAVASEAETPAPTDTEGEAPDTSSPDMPG
jgi:hypothetical protein